MYADDECVVEISCCCRCCVFSVLLTYAIAVVADAVYADTACVVGVCSCCCPCNQRSLILNFKGIIKS